MNLILSEYKPDFDKEYKKYEADYENYLTKAKSSFPQYLRLSNIRFRLTLSKRIGFDSSISYTKTKRTREIYRYLFKLNDAWFTYEAVLKLCDSEGYTRVQTSKFSRLDGNVNSNINLSVIDTSFNKLFKTEILSSSKKKNDILGALNYMESQSQRNLANALGSIRRKINAAADFDNKDILAIIYSIRNGYVHQGDAAGSGVQDFSAKTLLIQNLYSYSMSYLLKILMYVVQQKLSNKT